MSLTVSNTSPNKINFFEAGPRVNTSNNQTQATNHSANTHPDIHHVKPAQTEPLQTATNSTNILKRFINWIKSWFQKTETQTNHIHMSSPVAETKSTTALPEIEIFDGRLTINEMGKLAPNYVVIFGHNVENKAGLFGQGSVLKPALELYPNSVCGLPVSLKSIESYEAEDVKQCSFKESSPEEIAKNLKIIEQGIDQAIEKAAKQNKKILLLRGGYGTGFSRMNMFAPATFKGMVKLFEEKLGVTYHLNKSNGTYRLAYLNEKVEAEAPQNSKTKSALGQDLWADSWMVMNHGQGS